ncbi:tetratricopeptide repeat protein [Actinomycetaceae bacterium L2_0104]
MTNDPQAGGAKPLPAENLEILRDYLDLAPEELAEWAQEQKKQLGLDTVDIQEAPSVPTPEPQADGSDAEEDESEDFYNDMEGEDDILQLRRTPGSKKARTSTKKNASAGAAPAVKKTAAAKPGAAADASRKGARTAQRKGWSGLSTGSRMALVLLLIAGIAGGVKLAGQTGGDDTATVTPSMGSATAMGSGSGDVDSAARIAELTSVIEQDPQEIEARLELGVLYFNDRQIEQAQEQWLEVTELSPEDVTAWYNLGFSYLSMQPAEMELARDAWQRVVELDPQSEMARTVSMHMQGLEMPASSDEPTG